MRFGQLTRSPETPATGPGSPHGDGAYLTDGRRLFRVVAPLRSLERPDMAILEDCKTLNLVAFTADELSSMRMTPVTPARASNG
jgi:hypothetical protein